MEEQDFATEHSVMVTVATWQARGGVKGAADGLLLAGESVWNGVGLGAGVRGH